MPRRLRRGDGIVSDPLPDAGRHHAALAALGLHEGAGGEARLRGGRRRRRLRPALGRLSGVRGAHDRLESARCAREVDFHAHGRPADRHARPQHDRPRPARARQGREVPGDAHRLDRRPGRVPLAGRAGAHTQYDELHDGRLQDPGALRDLSHSDHEHDAHRRLSRRRPAGYRVRRREPRQPGGGGNRHGPGGAAPAQLHSPGGFPVRVADQRPLRRCLRERRSAGHARRRRSRSPTGKALPAGARNRSRPGSCAASASRPSSRTPASAMPPWTRSRSSSTRAARSPRSWSPSRRDRATRRRSAQIIANALQIPLEQGEDRAVRARHEVEGQRHRRLPQHRRRRQRVPPGGAEARRRGQGAGGARAAGRALAGRLRERRVQVRCIGSHREARRPGEGRSR